LLNSGTVVLNPSEEAMSGLAHFLSTSPLVSSFSFPDQDLLATFYKGRWKPLPWCYNALKTLRKVHKPLWRDEEVRCLHYILAIKPWQTKVVDEWEKEMHRWWWDGYYLLEDRLIEEGDDKTLRLIRENVTQ
jgi:lipopolysaccharide biosynthesis glycosyltransferase